MSSLLLKVSRVPIFVGTSIPSDPGDDEGVMSEQQGSPEAARTD